MKLKELDVGMHFENPRLERFGDEMLPTCQETIYFGQVLTGAGNIAVNCFNVETGKLEYIDPEIEVDVLDDITVDLAEGNFERLV